MFHCVSTPKGQQSTNNCFTFSRRRPVRPNQGSDAGRCLPVSELVDTELPSSKKSVSSWPSFYQSIHGIVNRFVLSLATARVASVVPRLLPIQREHWHWVHRTDEFRVTLITTTRQGRKRAKICAHIFARVLLVVLSEDSLSRRRCWSGEGPIMGKPRSGRRRARQPAAQPATTVIWVARLLQRT